MKRSFAVILFVAVSLFCILFFNNQYNPRIILANNILAKADSYYTGGNYDLEKAEKHYKQGLFLNPQAPYAHYQLARIYLVKGSLDNAKKEIDIELKNHPENKRSFYVRGLIDGYLQNYSEAQDDFRKFIGYAPNEWPGYMDLSWVLINNKKFSEALGVVEKGLEKFPDHIWLLSNRGLALYKTGKYEEAKSILEKDKELAKSLTSDDWRAAYPGNNSKDAESGVKEIQGVISYNLALVYKNLNEKEKYLNEVDYYQSLFPIGDSKRNKILDTL